MKQGDALLFNFAPEHAVRKVQETNSGLDMNGTHQVLAYADDVYFKGDKIRIGRNENVLLKACQGTYLAVDRSKSKYMEVGRNRGK